MKKFNLSLWHLAAVLLMPLVGISQANADELTVFDGENVNTQIPFYAEWGDTPQKNEFVMPASELAAMKDGKITNMQFYCTSEKSTPSFELKIFMKEVEQTSLTDFIGDEDATTVYEGTLTIADSKWSIELSTPYEYKGGNLLIGVYTTKVGNYTYLGFYGLKQDRFTALYGSSMSGTDYTSVTGVTNSFQFLPKTTFTYEPAEEVIEGTVLNNILALKNFQFADPMADSEDVVLTLDNAKVTYVNTENDFVVIEDESAGYALENSKLSSLVSAGQTLNGNLAMTILYGWAGNEYSLKNGIEGVTATDGEVTPFVVTEENAITFANDFDWRLAQVANVKINITTGEHGDQMSASIAQLANATLPINDRFNTITTTVEDGMVGTLTGFIFSAYGMTFCTPVSFVENVKAVELENLKALEEFTLEEGVDEVKAVLTLKDAKVTYVADNYDAVVIEDESTGYNFEYAGLNELLTAGQVLNGTFDITIAPFWLGTINVTVNNGLDNVESTTAEVTPIVVTEENISTYMNDYQWRYAEIANVVINVKQDEYGKYFTLSNELLGEEKIWINNTFKQFDETVEDGTTGTLRGFLFNSYSLLWFTPLSFEADVTSINNVENNMMNNGAIYNMKGQRLSAPVRGINIINGKKVVVK
jgi:hypothetical protein